MHDRCARPYGFDNLRLLVRRQALGAPTTVAVLYTGRASLVVIVHPFQYRLRLATLRGGPGQGGQDAAADFVEGLVAFTAPFMRGTYRQLAEIV